MRKPEEFKNSGITFEKGDETFDILPTTGSVRFTNSTPALKTGWTVWIVKVEKTISRPLFEVIPESTSGVKTVIVKSPMIIPGKASLPNNS